MTYTILSARYADAGNKSAVMQTQEAGAVAVSEVDTPALWALAVKHGIAAYQEPITPEPTPAEKLAASTGLTVAELKALVAGK